MKTYQLYIGANNDTKELELAKIEQIVGERHQGFTIYPATGYWMGTKEQSAVVVITDVQSKVNDTIRMLKSELKQDAVAWQALPVMHFA